VRRSYTTDACITGFQGRSIPDARVARNDETREQRERQFSHFIVVKLCKERARLMERGLYKAE